jgi:peptidoglycan/LPS O-acetylase OafA/YrhL
LSYGRIAVTTFIVVSGFCLMLPIAKRGDEMGSFTQYMVRRCRRILPPYFAALTLAIIFSLTVASQKLGTVWDLCLPVTWEMALQQYLLVHNFPWPVTGVAQPINYPLWSIAVEFQIYLFMPLILVSLKRWGNWPTILATVVFGAMIYYVLPEEWKKTSLWFLILFTLGAIAARESIRRKEAMPVAARWLTFGLWILSAALIPIVRLKLLGEYRFYYDILIGVATAMLLTVSMADTDRKYTLTRLLSWRPLVKIGMFSYSLYLMHASFLHGIYRIVHAFAKPSPATMFGVLLVCVPLILGGSYL